MRSPAIVVFAAAMLPVFAASPAAEKPAFSIDLPSSIDLSQSSLFAKDRGTRRSSRNAVNAVIEARRRPPRCYFIRQANGNLQKLKDKPEFVPLAAANAPETAGSDMTCLTDSLQPAAAR